METRRSDGGVGDSADDTRATGDPGKSDDDVQHVIPTDFLPSTMTGAAKWLAAVLDDTKVAEPDAVIVHRDRVAVMMPHNTGQGAHRDLASLLVYAAHLDGVTYTASTIQQTPAITLVTARGTQPVANGVRIDISGTVAMAIDRVVTARIGTDVAVTRDELTRATRA